MQTHTTKARATRTVAQCQSTQQPGAQQSEVQRAEVQRASPRQPAAQEAFRRGAPAQRQSAPAHAHPSAWQALIAATAAFALAGAALLLPTQAAAAATGSPNTAAANSQKLKTASVTPALAQVSAPASTRTPASAPTSHSPYARARKAAGSTDLPPFPKSFAAANQRLHENTAQLHGNAAILSAGDPLPAFALYDQQARPVLVPAQWQGKYIVISFIFTRCKVAAMCPAATAKMASLQHTLEQKGLAGRVQLLSISFDPRHDTPQVLRQYASLFGAKTDNYAFLTGPETTINDLLKRFGIVTQAEDGTITHSMVTALIDPDGNLSLRQIGSGWTTDAFLHLIEAQGAHSVATRD